MFIYYTVNFIFIEISAEFYTNARNREGLARGWGSGSDQKRNNSKFAILCAICQNNIL